MKKITLLILLILGAAVQTGAQNSADVLAKIGNISLREKDFASRYELSPHLGIHMRSEGGKLKMQLLEQLTAEKLLALDAMERKLDTIPIVKYTLDMYLKMFARDELYKREITEKSAGMHDSILSSFMTSALTGGEQEFRRLQKAAAEEAEDVYYKKFMLKFFKDKKINADGRLLRSAAEKLSAVLSEKKERKADADNNDNKVHLSVEDLNKVRDQFGTDSLYMTYINLGEREISLNDFLWYFRFEQFSLEDVSFMEAAKTLNSKTKFFIEQELLAEEALKRGLAEDGEVRWSYEMWRDNYLAQLVISELWQKEKVSDEEAYELFKEKKNAPKTEIKLTEIITDNLEQVEEILNKLQNGRQLEEIAAEYPGKSGIEGYFNPAAYGERGQIAAGMEIGEVYGPLQVEEGYSIFKLAGKRNIDEAVPFEEAKAGIKNELLMNRKKNKETEYLVKLAGRYGVEINEKALENIRTSNVNVLVYRYLGFGGKITAVPITLPQAEWYEEWKSNKEVF